MFMGALSNFKVAPFLCYFNRNESIKQFSFSEINQYLILNGEDKFRNPSRLFKKKRKDLILHRVALLSMMITMSLQTFPQIFIQGSYNTQNDKSKEEGQKNRELVFSVNFKNKKQMN